MHLFGRCRDHDYYFELPREGGEPRAVHLQVIVAAGKGWLASHPDNKEFWIDQGLGRRLCSLMEAILASDPQRFASDQSLRNDIDSLLGTLVRMGIAEAHRLEESLRLI
jgi:hypothetical protein